MKKIFGEKGILSGKRVLAATLVIVLLSGITLYSVAAGHEWKSQGNVEAVRSDGTKTVIFDKSDLDYLDGRIDAIEADVSTGKENLANALNPLGTNPSLGTPLSGTSTFNELMEAINHSQAIPDKTIGESVSIATEDYELASTVTGQTINSDTKISAATADNLSLGTSAWVDGSLVIGTGADNKNYYDQACPYIVDSTIGVGHVTGAGHYVRVLGGNVTFAPNGCKTFTISRMKLNSIYFSISEITNGTYTLSDDNTAYIITPIDNTSDVITKWSEIRTEGALTMCYIKSYT